MDMWSWRKTMTIGFLQMSNVTYIKTQDKHDRRWKWLAIIEKVLPTTTTILNNGKLADFGPWYSQNQQFSSSCCSTQVISGPCFWELKRWHRLCSVLQRAVGAGLDRWSTGWCLVWHSTWTTLHATARGSGFCQHAQSVVTVPFAPICKLPFLFHHLQAENGFQQGENPGERVDRSKKSGWNTALEAWVSPTSILNPCIFHVKPLIKDSFLTPGDKSYTLKKASFGEQIRFQLLQKLSSVLISGAKSKTAWKSSQIWVLFYSCQSVSPEGQGESAATAPSGFSVQLDWSNRPLSSLLEAKEVKAGRDAEDGLNKALFLPSLKRKPV